MRSNEEFGRIFGIPLVETYPAILQLAVHLEKGQCVYFTEANAIQVAHSPKVTTFTSFVKLCQNDPSATTILYSQVTSYYVRKGKKE